MDWNSLDEDGVEPPVKETGDKNTGHEQGELGSHASRFIALEYEEDTGEEVDGDLNEEDKCVCRRLGPFEMINEINVEWDRDQEGRYTDSEELQEFWKEAWHDCLLPVPVRRETGLVEGLLGEAALRAGEFGNDGHDE